MIGTRDEAITAWLIEQERQAFGNYEARTQFGRNEEWRSLSYGDEWVHMGAGCARSTWLSLATGVTYKVVYGRNQHQSVHEFETFKKFRKYAEPDLEARIPMMRDFTVDDNFILACETIWGTPGGDKSPAFRAMCDDIGAGDLHGGNYRTLPTSQVLIDLGM